MILQIPQEQLMDFWFYFRNHKFKNPLAQCLTRAIVKGYVDDLDNPDIIMFLCQQWACFLAGNSKIENLKEFLVKIPEKASIFVPSKEWELVLKNQWKYLGYLPRTELSAKNISSKSIRQLLLLNPLSKEFQVKKVDVETLTKILDQNLSEHWVKVIKHLGGPEKFVKEGVGFCIQEGEKTVSMVMGDEASVPITQSLEIDISTLPEYQGKGFATIESAKLIEYCLEKGIEPHWDAANQISVKLAQKLGYSDPKPYRCYYWRSKPWIASELRTAFDPQFEKGMEKIDQLKSATIPILKKEEVEKDNSSFLSNLTKTRGIFEAILLNINRFLETEIVKESDIPQFKEYAKKVERQLEILERL
ncbi:MAG: GNAT family N-acetyltransferase [Candidatus Hodarchaeales archaeon]